jgi:uncharacterized protein (DUF1697 family)
MRYIALLRGINVGGNTKVSMAELKEMFEGVGFANVKTYINSGNVAFDVESMQKPAREQGHDIQLDSHTLVNRRASAPENQRASSPGGSKGSVSQEALMVNEIELAIEKHFKRPIQVMIREQKAIEAILKSNPFDGEFEGHKEMHVLFMKVEMPKEQQELLLEKQTESERFLVKGREVYCHLKLGVADSLLGKGFIEKKLKVPITGRNWRTVEKLAEL